MTSPSPPKNRLAQALVIAQFVLAAAIFLSTAWSPGTVGWAVRLAGALLLCGSGLAIWAWWTMGLRRLRVMPHPAEKATLLRHGPYRWVRHPMYGGLLMAALGAFLWDRSMVRGGLWLGLLLVLLLKTSIEEQLLDSKFADYAEYRSQTWRFLPGLW